MKWQDISVDMKTLAPGGCLPLPRGYIHVQNYEKMFKIRRQRDFLELATNDRSDPVDIKIWPQGVVSPCPEATFMYKIMTKYIKSDLKEIFLNM